MSKIYIDPPVPFKIDVNLTDQKKFIIKARALAGVKRFTFNFQKGKLSSPENIAFHFDVRFDRHVVHTNYKKDGEWGSEKRISNFPFSETEQFTIEVLVDNDMFTVEVNSIENTRFLHQLPIQFVDTLAVEGDVFLAEVQVM